ncbi:MAG: Na+/H+ antiporter NhaA [Pseudomonadota bacterium]
MPVQAIREFLQKESASGLLIISAALLAIIAVNTPLESLYDNLLETPVAIQVGALLIHKPLLLWINDGLMAVFFFLVGLEIKREVLDGELSDPSRVALPAIAAVGGMLVPASFYVYFNYADPAAMTGWAIPMATDIAFALGILSLLGSRVPVALKVFLLTLAIIDDLGAIVIIAIFYSSDISTSSLIISAVALVVLLLMNRGGVIRIAPYILVGTILWIAVLKSGVHATLAGVLLAFFIPLKKGSEEHDSPLHHLEHVLHPYVAFMIMPLFAFANAGIPLEGMSPDSLLNPVPLGIITGLFIGKQIGVFGFAWLAAMLRLGRLPEGVTWLQLYGVSALCGIGFTMSLFISSLAAEEAGMALIAQHRLGILGGTLLSAVTGYLVLSMALRSRKT